MFYYVMWWSVTSQWYVISYKPFPDNNNALCGSQGNGWFI